MGHDARGRRSSWGDAEDDYLRAHYNKDMTPRQIADHLGMTKNQVIGRAHRIKGVAKRKQPTPQEILEKQKQQQVRREERRRERRRAAPQKERAAREAAGKSTRKETIHKVTRQPAPPPKPRTTREEAISFVTRSSNANRQRTVPVTLPQVAFLRDDRRLSFEKGSAA